MLPLLYLREERKRRMRRRERAAGAAPMAEPAHAGAGPAANAGTDVGRFGLDRK